MFQSAKDLKAAIGTLDPDDFIDQHVLGVQSPHLTDDNVTFFCQIFSNTFGVNVAPAHLVTVGSAKIGYALFEKRTPSFTLPAFRAFSAISDVDLAICNPDLFKKIWHELSAYACFQAAMPWNPDKLADYLMYGWLRPDKFPKGKALMYCDRFYETVAKFRKDRKRGHPRTSVALYYSVEHLKRYQARGVRLCKQGLEAAK